MSFSGGEEDNVCMRMSLNFSTEGTHLRRKNFDTAGSHIKFTGFKYKVSPCPSKDLRVDRRISVRRRS